MSGFKDYEFVTQYALRMPDGQLYGCKTYNPREQMEDALFGGMGFGFFMNSGDDEPPDEIITTPPTVWYDRREAERCLEAIRDHQKGMGVSHWAAVIVERLCSPFTGDEAGPQFTDEISSWLKDQ